MRFACSCVKLLCTQRAPSQKRAASDVNEINFDMFKTALDRICFVGEARTNVTKFGYINKVPELLTVKLYGSSGNGKRKLGGLEGATLELNEAKPKTVNTIQAAHGLTKDVVYGMCAALSKSY